MDNQGLLTVYEIALIKIECLKIAQLIADPFDVEKKAKDLYSWVTSTK